MTRSDYDTFNVDENNGQIRLRIGPDKYKCCLEKNHANQYEIASIRRAVLRNPRLSVLVLATILFLCVRKRENVSESSKNSLGILRQSAYSSLTLAALNDTTESVGFLNDMVADMWPFINIAASKMIKDIVEPMFSDLLPGPLKATKFKKIDLGTQPMKFDRIDVVDHSNNSIKLDVDITWDGKCSIVLSSPMVGNYGVKRIQLKGRMSILMKPLVSILPVMGAMQAGFLNPPDISMDFTGIADFADTFMIKKHIWKVIDDVFAQLLVVPNRLLVPVTAGLDFFKTYVLPYGVLRVKLVSGSGFKTQGAFFGDVPDVYVWLRLGGEKQQKSKTIKNSNDPEWNEMFDFIYSDEEQKIELIAYEDDLTNDDKLGTATITAKLLLASMDGTLDLPLIRKGKDTGAKLKISAEFLPFDDNPDNFESHESFDNQIYGMLSVVVASATQLPNVTNLEPYCKVKVGKDKEFQTPVITKVPGVDPRAPPFNSVFRVPLSEKLLAEQPSVTFSLYSGSTDLGSETILYEQLLSAPNQIYREPILLEGGIVNASIILNSLAQ